MKRQPISILVLMAAVLTVVACGPAAAPRVTTDGASGEVRSTAPKSLTIALEGEPEYLLLPALGGGGGTGQIGGNLRLAVHQQLSTYDDRGDIHPQLAIEVPAVDKGTWVVRPDGTMQTTYRLHRNVTWHDGTPLTAKDFVFGWTVQRDRDLPLSGRGIADEIGQIATTDDATLVLEWVRSYPFANAIVDDAIGPIPTHLLEAIYQADKERFAQLPYWKAEFVGVGPYRVTEWEPGSHLVVKAYDNFYRGRAKIDTLTFRFISSAPTVVANLLSGAIDGQIPRAIDFTQSMFVKSEWERAGQRPSVIVQPTHYRHAAVRFNDPTPRELLDPRVRRGLMFALDRQALVDALLDGQAPVADTFVTPDDPRWEWVKDVVARYPYDPRQAEQQFAAVGWQRGAGGNLVNATGAPVSIQIWTTGGQQNEQEAAIVADSWKGAGIQAEQFIVPSAQARDNRFRASYPAFTMTAVPLRFENLTNIHYGALCPTEENRFSGSNNSCYRNPAMDSITDGLRSAIAPEDQRRWYRDWVRLHTEDLPTFPLYFNVQVTLFREGVTGVKGDTKPRTTISWNIAEWDVR